MGILQVLRLEFWKFRILEILNFHLCDYENGISLQAVLKRKQNLAAASNVKAENAHTKMPNFVKFYKVNQDLTFKVPITISADDSY